MQEGSRKKPTYRDVASGKTSHVEAVEIIYDANVVDYQTLLNVFWRQIDPTDNGGQFVDRGFHYTTAIFYTTPQEQELAELSKEHLEQSGWFDKPIVTAITPHTAFYPAEKYHQDYYKKNPIRYKFYKKGSGREHFINKTWGDEADDSDEIPLKDK